MEWLLALLGLTLLAAGVSPRNRAARIALWLAVPLVLLLVLLGRFLWSPDFWRDVAASNWQQPALIIGAALLGIFLLAGGWRRK